MERCGAKDSGLSDAIMIGVERIVFVNEFGNLCGRWRRYGDRIAGYLQAQVPVINEPLRLDEQELTGDHHASDRLEKLLVIGGHGGGRAGCHCAAAALRAREAAKSGERGGIVVKSPEEIEGAFERPARAHVFPPQELKFVCGAESDRAHREVRKQIRHYHSTRGEIMVHGGASRAAIAHFGYRIDAHEKTSFG